MQANGQGRHSAGGRSRSVAPVVALLAVIALAIGGWAFLGRGSTDGAGTAAAQIDPPRLADLIAAPTTPARVASTPLPVLAATTSPAAPTFASEVTRLTNIERARAGCGALRVEPKLQTAAELHSKDMVDRNYFSHTSPEGKGPGDRAAAQGYTTWSGENIAAGYPTPSEVVAAWMASTGHRANILNCRSTSTGVGFDPRASMWTQMFGFV